MKIIAILVCLAVISIVQATKHAKISKPKLHLVHSENRTKSPDVKKHKSPEERRKLSLFPKSHRKFVVSLEPHHKHVSHKHVDHEIVHGTKKPLMKKIVLQDKIPNQRNIAIENDTERPIMTNKLLYENDLHVIHKAEPGVISEKLSIEIVEAKEEGDERQNDNIEEKNKLQNQTNEFKTATAHNANEDFLHLKDLILPSDAKLAEVSLEKKSIERFSDTSDVIKNSKDEIPDLKEFIFVDPIQYTTLNDKISSEASEEYFTTEIPEEPKIFRRKRSSNVIEEENLGTTVAGYKYTWKDTRLTNDLVFKNINS